MDLQDKVAFITGSAGGIGKGLAEALLEKGVKVYLGDKNEELGDATLKEFQSKYGPDMVSFSVMDVTSDDQFQEVFDKAVHTFGPIHIMINNAGIVDEMNFEATINVNAVGTIRGTRIAENHMRTDQNGAGGRIINISSAQSFLSPFVVPAYCASKHAIRAFTSCMSQRPEKREQGVQYAVLCPDATEVGMSRTWDPNTVYPEYYDLCNQIKQDTPLIPLTRIVEGMMDLLCLENMSGAVLVVGFEGKEYRKLSWESSDTFNPEEPASFGGIQG